MRRGCTTAAWAGPRRGAPGWTRWRGLLELFDTRYWDFNAKHFHEKLVAEHGVRRSYNWVRLTLQAHGRVRAAPRRGAHRRKRPRRALPGMMLHQDGSRHEWTPGRQWDLIVTLDDATSEVCSAFFVAEEGAMSSFRALHEVIAARGLFCSLYTDRGSHYFHTPEAGGKVDKDNPTQVGRALRQLGIEHIAAYSPEARGRSERMFATLQKRLPQELRLAAITDIDEANRFLQQVYLPGHNARFATPPEAEGSAFVPFAGALDDILCIHEGAHRLQRQHRALQETLPATPDRPPPPPLRQGQGPGPRIPRPHPRPSSTDPGASPATAATANPSTPTPTPARLRDPLRRNQAMPCGEVDGRYAPDHFPTGPTTPTESGQSIWYIIRSILNVLDSKICNGCR